MSKVILQIIIIREKFICCNTANYYIHSEFFPEKGKRNNMYTITNRLNIHSTLLIRKKKENIVHCYA
jgi:hypothetical protein